MAKGGGDRTPVAAGVSLLIGVSVGTAVVLAVALGIPPPLRLAFGLPEPSEYAPMGCDPTICVNLTVEFRASVSLDPGSVRLTLLPTSASTVVNGTAGAPLHFAYLPAGDPRWQGELGPGDYNASYGADFVDVPGGLVGSGGATAITPGATLCLKIATASIHEYRLIFSADGATASVLIDIA